MVKGIRNAKHIKNWKKEEYVFAKLRLILTDYRIRKMKIIGDRCFTAVPYIVFNLPQLI